MDYLQIFMTLSLKPVEIHNDKSCHPSDIDYVEMDMQVIFPSRQGFS